MNHLSQVTIRNDYPAITILADAVRDKADDSVPEAVRAWREVGRLRHEVERLRQWKAEATAVLDEWEGVWMIAGQPGRLGASKAQAVAHEVQRLRSACDAWMNGVADVVEPLGYDRGAACGPADLLPGLTELRVHDMEMTRRLAECVEARSYLYEQVVELSERLERHPVATGGARMLDPGPLSLVTHRFIPQTGANVCVCGEWFDAEVHQMQQASPAPDGNDRRQCACGHPQAVGVLHRTDGPCFHAPNDNDLPGMWERADFEGGADEVRP